MHPAEVVGQNELSFDRDTGVVTSNAVLNRSPGPPGRGDLGPKPSVRSEAMQPIAKLLWPLTMFHHCRSSWFILPSIHWRWLMLATILMTSIGLCTQTAKCFLVCNCTVDNCRKLASVYTERSARLRPWLHAVVKLRGNAGERRSPSAFRRGTPCP